MASAPMDLFNLVPAEIIQHIASHCSFHDLLSLGLTCHHFDEIINDPVFLQRYFFDRMGDPTARAFPTRASLVRRVKAIVTGFPESEEDKKGENENYVWSRLAVAASRLPALVKEFKEFLLQHEGCSGVFMDKVASRAPIITLGVLSCFAVIGYPTTLDETLVISLTCLAIRLFSKPWLEDLEIWDSHARDCIVNQASLCLAIAMTGGRHPRADIPVPWADSFRRDLAAMIGHTARVYALRQTWWFYGTNGTDIGNFVAIFRPNMGASEFDSRFRWIRPHSVAMLIVARIVSLLDDCSNKAIAAEELPVNVAVPLATIQDLVLPILEPRQVDPGLGVSAVDAFDAMPVWADWLARNIKQNTEKISEGEWVGWCGDKIRQVLEGPMRNIRFVVAEEPRGGDMVISAKGCQMYGRKFHIEGCLSDKGVFTGSRIMDLGGDVMLMKGALSPMGLAGWCRPRNSNPFNSLRMAFWFYKTEWVPPSTAPKSGSGGTSEG